MLRYGMDYIKLPKSFINSSLWFDKPARSLFITCLLMAEKYVIKEPKQSIDTQTHSTTANEAFVIPPGFYGLVRTPGIAIIYKDDCWSSTLPEYLILSGKEIRHGDFNEGMAALVRLSLPDKHSLSQKFEGREIARIEEGFVILNYADYAGKDQKGAERAKRYRERKKQREAEGDGIYTHHVSAEETNADAIYTCGDVNTNYGCAKTPSSVKKAEAEDEINRRRSEFLRFLSARSGKEPLEVCELAECGEEEANAPNIYTDDSYMYTVTKDAISVKSISGETKPTISKPELKLEPVNIKPEPTKKTIPNCPHKEIIKLFAEVIPEAPGIRDWTPMRQSHLQARWKQYPDLNTWRTLFTEIRESDFLMGRIEQKDKRPFLISLDWLVRANNFAKVIEGKYH